MQKETKVSKWNNLYVCEKCGHDFREESMCKWNNCPKCHGIAYTQDITFRTKGADLKRQ